MITICKADYGLEERIMFKPIVYANTIHRYKIVFMALIILILIIIIIIVIITIIIIIIIAPWVDVALALSQLVWDDKLTIEEASVILSYRYAQVL